MDNKDSDQTAQVHKLGLCWAHMSKGHFLKLQLNSYYFQAAMILERAGFNPGQILNTAGPTGSGLGGAMERVTYCNIPLPLPEPTIPESTPVAEKLFIVCQPAAVPERILRDAFSRFGNLIDVYLLSGYIHS